MADTLWISRKNKILTFLLLLALIFNLGMVFQNRITTSSSNLRALDSRTRVFTLFDDYIHVAFFGKFAYKKMKIIRGIDRMFQSILENTDVPIYLHVLLDSFSKERTGRTLRKVARGFHRRLNVTFHDVNEMSRQNQETIDYIKKIFFNKDVGRYNDPIFFLSQIFHEAFPKRLHKIIFLDIDLVFKEDIQKLYDEFSRFKDGNVIGIGPDLQPQYRSDFAKFRTLNPNTTVGSPRPGLQGFNTGVVLFDLDRMRKSALYNSLLNSTLLEILCDKYQFRGYLGHQDFFTLTGMEYPQLYHMLDCNWNRQLDVGWRKKFGHEIFDEYHKCEGKIKVIHANGDSIAPINTRVPSAISLPREQKVI